MSRWTHIPDDKTLLHSLGQLAENGITAEIVANREEAKDRVTALLPKGAEVMDMTSVTLTETGIQEEILNSGKYKPVKKLLEQETNEERKRQLGAAPDYAVGSVHAVTQDGHVLIASNTGSQLPAYVYGAKHVIWVVGAQKIVKNTDEGMKRIYEYVLPLEADRARKAYGAPGSNVSKLLIISKEVNPRRLHMILVKEHLGF